ncbi:MAG: hypothetical protein U0235_24100 [Polyangiaceae bacterium]
MLGVRDQQIASVLKRYGFSEAELQEGWRLLAEAGASTSATWATADTEATLEALDAWENQWFPIVQATLERRFPTIHAAVFRNLAQTTGAEVAIGVRTLLDRLATMAKGQGEYGPDGIAARKTLETRGVTEATLAEPRALLDRLARIADNGPGLSPSDVAAADAADEAMWNWYLEWSRIARAVVSGRVLLRRLGFLQGGYARGGTDEGVDATADDAGVSDEAPHANAADAKPTAQASGTAEVTHA